jgi:hypothetical protein
MPGLVQPCAGHPRLFASAKSKTWMAGTSLDKPGHDGAGDNRYLFIRHCHGKRRQFKAKTLEPAPQRRSIADR